MLIVPRSPIERFAIKYLALGHEDEIGDSRVRLLSRRPAFASRLAEFGESIQLRGRVLGSRIPIPPPDLVVSLAPIAHGTASDSEIVSEVSVVVAPHYDQNLAHGRCLDGHLQSSAGRLVTA